MRILIIMLLLFSYLEPALAEFDNGRADFSIIVNNEVYPYRIFATYVLPNERLVIRINEQSDRQIDVKAGAGSLEQTAARRWIWTVPDKTGLTTISLTRVDDGESITLNVFVMIPSSRVEKGRLNGFQIGVYPPPLGDDPLYARPDGFIKVSRENLSTRVAPHFVLGQFVSPLNDEFPKYIVLRERLLLKLEALLERLNERDIAAESFGIIAGYLTPAYNATTGRDRYSRHIYGGAAVFIVDRDPADGIMDDLNGDGNIDDADGRLLFELADELYQEPGRSYLRGGLFLYGKVSRGGPSVMVDARGYRKRWRDDNDLFASPEDVRNNLQELRPKHSRDFK